MGRRFGGVTCARCGKKGYGSKREAKAAVKQLAQIGKRHGKLHPYRCGEVWHLGHLPENVARGRASRRDLADPKTPRPQPVFARTEFDMSTRKTRRR